MNEVAKIDAALPQPLTSTDRRLEALKLLKDWSVWMVGVETALIGFLGTLDVSKAALAWTSGDIRLILGWLGVSIVFAAWTLSAIPSLVQRKEQTSDLWRMPLYDLPLIREIPFGVITFIQHACFIVAILILISGAKPR